MLLDEPGTQILTYHTIYTLIPLKITKKYKAQSNYAVDTELAHALKRSLTFGGDDWHRRLIYC